MLTPPQLSASAVRERLAAAGFTRSHSVSAVEPADSDGFSGAAVWRVQIDSRWWAFRRWPVDAPAEDRLRELHRFVAHLRKSEISEVAVPVANDLGDSLPRIKGRFWHLEPWMPGTPAAAGRTATSQLRRAMEALALLHVAAARYEATARGLEWFAGGTGACPAVTERLGKLCELHDMVAIARSPAETGWQAVLVQAAETVMRLTPQLVAELGNCRVLRAPLQPCLRDVWRAHVLFVEERVTGVIDPSATRTDSVAADISRLAGSLIGSDAALWSAALDAYAAVRPLGDVETRLIPLLHRSGVLLSAVHWLRQCAGIAESQIEPHWRSRAAEMFAQLNELARV